MSGEDWESVGEVSGQGQAEILRGLLEAQGIDVWLSEEGAAKAIGITIPALGAVHIMVPTHEVERARSVLDAYYSGALEKVEMDAAAVQQIEKELQAEEKDQDLIRADEDETPD